MAAKRSRNGPSADVVFDELLVTMVIAGDHRAAEHLFKRWNPRLLRTARRLAGESKLAAPIVQDTWLAIWRGIANLRDPARFGGWAFGILRRRSSDAIGRHIRDRSIASGTDPDEMPSAAMQDETLAIEQAFASLGPDHRLAAHLYFVEGLTLAEIAGVQGVPEGTAKSRLFHARRQLKAALSGESS